MKKILVSNRINMLLTFKVLYSLPNSKKTTEIKSGTFPNPLFRIVEIPENAKNIVITIKTIDSKGKKKIIGETKQEHATDTFYEVYASSGKTKFRNVDSAPFIGACSIYGVNNSSSIMRARILYTVGKEGKYYISDPIKKGQFFAFVLPNTFNEVQIKVEKAKDVQKGIWRNIYVEVFTHKSLDFKNQKCYEISKPLLKDFKCTPINCSNI